MRYEPFLDHLSRKLRRTLLKFRLSDHKLMIEEGRHFRPKVPRENRWCKYCKTEVEDEQHMLIDCKLYGNRPTWFNKISKKCPIFTTMSSHQKFIFLMTQEDNQLVKETAEKIADWTELRDLIYSHFFWLFQMYYPCIYSPLDTVRIHAYDHLIWHCYFIFWCYSHVNIPCKYSQLPCNWCYGEEIYIILRRKMLIATELYLIILGILPILRQIEVNLGWQFEGASGRSRESLMSIDAKYGYISN